MSKSFGEMMLDALEADGLEGFEAEDGIVWTAGGGIAFTREFVERPIETVELHVRIGSAPWLV